MGQGLGHGQGGGEVGTGVGSGIGGVYSRGGGVNGSSSGDGGVLGCVGVGVDLHLSYPQADETSLLLERLREVNARAGQLQQRLREEVLAQQTVYFAGGGAYLGGTGTGGLGGGDMGMSTGMGIGTDGGGTGMGTGMGDGGMGGTGMGGIGGPLTLGRAHIVAELKLANDDLRWRLQQKQRLVGAQQRIIQGLQAQLDGRGV
ncbi:hypothetical protein B484DRAFT_441708 [Ochromonadaceae sp. CCMP2298]|nr:hypothetical protein B484DRAFT_441708 [Ochromonadaceae sp. CCMP2298]